jgi:hypothetical protein
VVIETKSDQNSFDSKDSVTRSTKKRNPLEINRIPQVIVNTIKTAKKKKEKIPPDQFKINSHQEKNQNLLLFISKKSFTDKSNQFNSNNRLRKIKYWKITLKICLSAK